MNSESQMMQRYMILHHTKQASLLRSKLFETQKDRFDKCLPYSSDLAHSDFFLFPFIKNKAFSHRFSNAEEAYINHTLLRYKFLNGI